MSATEVPVIVQLVLTRNYLQYLACRKLGVNTKFFGGLPKDIQRVFEQQKNLTSVTTYVITFDYKNILRESTFDTTKKCNEKTLLKKI